MCVCVECVLISCSVLGEKGRYPVRTSFVRHVWRVCMYVCGLSHYFRLPSNDGHLTQAG